MPALGQINWDSHPKKLYFATKIGGQLIFFLVKRHRCIKIKLIAKQKRFES